MTGHDESILRIARALNELRGLDSHMIHELNLPAEDLIGTCTVAASVLMAYVVAPEWAKTAILASGVMGISGIQDRAMMQSVWDEQRGRDAMKRLGKL